MAKPTGFMEYQRQNTTKRPVDQRLNDYSEIEISLSQEDLQTQASRCMDCGIPFCHAYGCPVSNLIPDFNEMIYRNQWQRALEILHSTNNFPEFTGKICPAPCEAACTLTINMPAVNIKHIELQIVEKGWQNGWIKPVITSYKSGKKVAVVGSGPAGLAAAQQLARQGHEVVVFEKDNRLGGLLRYGIPDFKLDKAVIDRRIEQMEAEGVTFETNVTAGYDVSARYLERSFDAVLIAAGSSVPRDLKIAGRELNGIHFAMEFLAQSNKAVAGDTIYPDQVISAKGKNVVVIGGGDTGSDCIGTSNRQGAKSVTQIELLPKPPVDHDANNPWPEWPIIVRTSSSHEEGCERMWSINSLEFAGQDNQVTSLKCNKLTWKKDESGKMSFEAIPDSEFVLEADLVFLAMGFVHTFHGTLVEYNNLALDNRGNIAVDENYMSSKEGVFVAGDAMSGASLVVRAIDHGRKAAAAINEFLK